MDVGFGLDDAVLTDDRTFLDPGRSHDVGVLSDHRASQVRAPPQEHVVVEHGAVGKGLGPHHGIAADDRVLP